MQCHPLFPTWLMTSVDESRRSMLRWPQLFGNHCLLGKGNDLPAGQWTGKKGRVRFPFSFARQGGRRKKWRWRRGVHHSSCLAFEGRRPGGAWNSPNLRMEHLVKIRGGGPAVTWTNSAIINGRAFPTMPVTVSRCSFFNRLQQEKAQITSPNYSSE